MMKRRVEIMMYAAVSGILFGVFASTENPIMLGLAVFATLTTIAAAIEYLSGGEDR